MIESKRFIAPGGWFAMSYPAAWNEFEDGEKFYSKVKMLLWLVERYKEVNGSDSGSGQGESE